jgi:RNA polymerase sigma factor (sigma-70 family)
MTDKEVLDGFIEGNSKAFKIIEAWIRERTRVKLWEKRVAPDDIVGDTLEKLLENFRNGDFKFQCPLKGYVQRVTYYTIVNTIRRVSIENDYIRTLKDIDSEDPLFQLLIKEKFSLYQRMLYKIDEKCRNIFNLIFDEGLKLKDIGKRLKTSEGATKTKKSRCIDDAIEIIAELNV